MAVPGTVRNYVSGASQDKNLQDLTYLLAISCAHSGGIVKT